MKGKNFAKDRSYMCSRGPKKCRQMRGTTRKRERNERLAKRKQWISFNLIQLIYYGKRDITKPSPIVLSIHFSPQTDDTCPAREHIKLTQMFIVLSISSRPVCLLRLRLVHADNFCNLSQNIYINRKMLMEISFLAKQGER
jgi:hypothetical protein